MMSDSYTLIISNSKESEPDFFLVPNSEISSEKRKVLNQVCNMKLKHDMPDEEYDKIVTVKYSIQKTAWYPSSVPESWRGCFADYKTNIPVFCPNITSVVLVH